MFRKRFALLFFASAFLAPALSCKRLSLGSTKGIVDKQPAPESGRKALAKALLAEIQDTVAQSENCVRNMPSPLAGPGIFTPAKLSLRQKKSFGMNQGPLMEIFNASNAPGARTSGADSQETPVGTMNVRAGNALTLGAGSTDHFVMEMIPTSNGNPARPLSFARFPKSTVDGSFEIQYEQRPVVEIFSCQADYETLRSNPTPSQHPLMVMRAQSVNGSRKIDFRMRVRALREALAKRCPNEPPLQYRLGEACDEITIGSFYAIPKELRTEFKLPPAIKTEESVYAISVMGTKEPVTFISFTSENEYLVHDNSKAANGSATVSETSGIPFELWFAYFLRFEKHIETYNSQLQEGAGEIAGEVAGLLPGGTLIAKGFEFAVSKVLDFVFTPEQKE